MNRVLFLCSGNYYRSRMAEEYFNHCADLNNMSWRADSMALLTDLENTGNEGPICADAIAQLTANGIPIHSPSRMPKPLIHQEILNFSRFISMSKAEHKPMVDQKWPGTFPYMEYWEIGDIGTDAPEDAFLKICQGVEQLIHELLQENC